MNQAAPSKQGPSPRHTRLQTLGGQGREALPCRAGRLGAPAMPQRQAARACPKHEAAPAPHTPLLAPQRLGARGMPGHAPGFRAWRETTAPSAPRGRARALPARRRPAPRGDWLAGRALLQWGRRPASPCGVAGAGPNGVGARASGGGAVPAALRRG